MQSEYAHAFADKCLSAGLRVTVDDRNEKIGYKIREAQLEKLPYMVIVGAKETEDGTVSVRARSGEELGTMSAEDFISLAVRQTVEKKR